MKNKETLKINEARVRMKNLRIWWRVWEREGGILVRKREDRWQDDDKDDDEWWIPPKRRGMRKMFVVGEPMGIEAAEKPLVGTPGGDPTTLISALTFPVALHPSVFSSSCSVSFLLSAESYESTKADRTLYHVGSFLSSLCASPELLSKFFLLSSVKFNNMKQLLVD